MDPDPRLPVGELSQPFPVIFESTRCGLVRSREALARLLAHDADAQVRLFPGGRRGHVILTDLDAWLLIDSVFKLRDFLPRGYSFVRQMASGHRCYELVPSRRIRPPGADGLRSARIPARRCA